MTAPLVDEVLTNGIEGNEYHFFVRSNIEKKLLEFIFQNRISNIKIIGSQHYIFQLFVFISSYYSSFYFVQGTSAKKYWFIALLMKVRSFGITKVIGPKSNNSNLIYYESIPEEGHKVNYYLNYLSKASIIEYPTKLIQTIRKQVEKNLDDKYIVISPGSSEGEKHKRWENKKWNELIILIMDKHPNIKVKLIGTESELPFLEDIKTGLNSNVEIVVLNNFEQSFGVLVNSEITFTVCNGTSHLAAISGTRTISIYGPTNPDKTGVFGKVSVRVFNKKIECGPCYKLGYIQGCGKPVCMTDISAEEIFAFMNNTEWL